MDPYEAKEFGRSKDFFEYSSNIQDIHKNIEEYNQSQKYNLLIVFDDMVAHMISNKKLSPILAELFIRGGELNISIFISYTNFLSSTKRCWAKPFTFFSYENFKQTRASTNRIYSFSKD